jgi:hypothetical protein
LVDVAHLAIDPFSLFLAGGLGAAGALALCGKTLASVEPRKFFAVIVLLIISALAAIYEIPPQP